MKFKRICALVLALASLALMIAGCNEPDTGPSTPTVPSTPTEDDPTLPSGTEPVGTDPTGTEPAGTDPTGTEPTGTDPTGTEPPTLPPETLPPETVPSGTQPPETDPPTQATNPPTQATNPPTQATNPPTQATNPPTQATNPPTQATNPPTQSTKPPTQATNPPTQATKPPTLPTLPTNPDGFTDQTPVNPNLGSESNGLQSSPPAYYDYAKVKHPGTKEEKSNDGTIDYSNTSDGYVMVRYQGSFATKIQAVVNGPTTQYQYILSNSDWVALPLSDGNGAYKVRICVQRESDGKYATATTLDVTVKLKDEFAPFVRSNQYVNFEAAPKTIKKAAELCAGLTDPLDKVKAIYKFVVESITYDKNRAATVTSGYLPNLDDVLAKKKGICFDYAALMTGMLRSQGVPCKLVVGYSGTAYHAWINVYSEKNGWINNAIFFDGKSWQRMDPTYASSGKQSDTVMKYIGDGKNYTAKYLY